MARKLEKMKIKIVSIIVLSAAIFIACKSQKNVAQSSDNAPKERLTASASTTQTANVTSKSDKKRRNSIEQIAMNRSACMGTCPVYKVEVNKSGKVTYYGMSFVDYKGTYEKIFAKDRVAGLFSQFMQYKVDTCSEDYESMIADVPGVYYQITYSSGDKQKINNAHFGPEFLKTLSFEVDSFAKVDASWKKVADAEDN